MVNFFSIFARKNKTVHLSAFPAFQVADSDESFRLGVPMSTPVPLTQPFKISGIYNRILSACQWDKAVGCIQRLSNGVSFHAINSSHRSTSNGLLQLSRYFIIAVLLLVFSFPVFSQVPVTPAPPIKLQFFSNAGIPLASGCLFSYIAGTSTPLATYTDSTGTAQNSNPQILDAGGRVSVWLPNSSYKFTLKSAGGVNCAAGSTIWTVDSVTGVFGLLNLNNTWSGIQTFSQPIIINVNTNQIQAGTVGNRTTLNFPAPAGNITLNMPSTADTMVGRATTDTLTNKSLTSPTINTVSVTGPPGTYALVSNEAVTGTAAFRLTKLTGAPSTAITAAAIDTGGIVGICIISCANTGIATLQLSGITTCSFDATGTVAGHYVQISSTTAGSCHDAGATYPLTGQVIGRALVTSAGPSSQVMVLFGPEINPATPAVTSVVYSTPSASTNANIGATTMATSGASGNTYRFSFYLDQTGVGAACGANTTITVAIIWTDPQVAITSQVAIKVYTITLNGALGNVNVDSTQQTTVRSKAATAVQYTTVVVPGAACAPVPSYQLYPILEQIS